MGLSFGTICERMRAHAVYTSNGLQFPRATEEEIKACEERLGFPLPPMLRELYTTVGNGSDFFGPGYWFSTITENSAKTPANYPVLGRIVGSGPRPFDDTTVESLRAHPGSYVVCERTPTGFVEFAHIGCNVWAHLDGLTGHVYIRDDHYEEGEFKGAAFSFCAYSLEEWLERWLATPPSKSSEGRYQPHYPLADLADEEDKRDKNAEDGEQTADSPARRFESPITSFRRRQRTGLERTRMEITRQIYDLDIFQQSVVVNASAQRDELYAVSELSSIMQQLADLEAQIDAMIFEALITTR